MRTERMPCDHRICATLIYESDLLTMGVYGDLIFNATCAEPILPVFVTGNCNLGLTDTLQHPRTLDLLTQCQPTTGRRPVCLHAPGGSSLDTVCAQLGARILLHETKYTDMITGRIATRPAIAL